MSVNATEALPESPIPAQANAQKIDPWNVQGEIDENGKVLAINYKKLTEEFGTKLIDSELLDRWEKVVGVKPHRFMRRGIVFSHRDLDLILDRYEKGEPFYLYTGRGPSSDSMHIGHTVPFSFTKWLSDVLDVPLVIMLTDDEKFLFTENTIEDVQSYCRQNVRDIISVGFDPKKTFIFSDFEFMGGAFYRNVVRMSKYITHNQSRAIFGFDGSSNIGKIHFGAIQGATAFASTFPHIFGEDEKVSNSIPALIPCAIDQDPYFRMTRDVAQRIHYAKPALIHSSFLPALQGPGSKMSASIDISAIFMADSPGKIKSKISKHAFSGGGDTLELHREKGGNPDVDVAYQYLTFFMEDDDELQRIHDSYKRGEMLTGELKELCTKFLQEYVKGFQERRAQVTDEVVRTFMSTRKLEWKGNPRAPRAQTVVPVVQEADGVGEDGKPLTKNQLKKIEKAKAIAAAKAEKEREKAAAAAAAAAAKA